MRGPSVLALLAVAVCLFLLAPLLIVLVASFTSAGYVSFPPSGFSFRWYQEIGRREDFLSALGLSVQIATLASLCALGLGLLGGLAFTRYRLPGEGLLAALFLSPLVLPGVVLGLAILRFAVLLGLSGGLWTIVAGHVLVTAPLTIRLLTAALGGLDPALDRAARSLGADPWRAFRSVTLPLIAPTALAAGLLAFVVSFDDVNIALFLSGPRTTTLPVLLFSYASQETSPVLSAASSLLIIVVVVVAFMLDRIVGIRRTVGAA